MTKIHFLIKDVGGHNPVAVVSGVNGRDYHFVWDPARAAHVRTYDLGNPEDVARFDFEQAEILTHRCPWPITVAAEVDGDEKSAMDQIAEKNDSIAGLQLKIAGLEAELAKLTAGSDETTEHVVTSSAPPENSEEVNTQNRHAEQEFEAGAALAREGKALPDLASPAAQAGFKSVSEKVTPAEPPEPATEEQTTAPESSPEPFDEDAAAKTDAIPSPLAELTDDELRDRAKAAGVKGYSQMKREKLIAKLSAAVAE